MKSSVENVAQFAMSDFLVSSKADSPFLYAPKPTDTWMRMATFAKLLTLKLRVPLLPGGIKNHSEPSAPRVVSSAPCAGSTSTPIPKLLVDAAAAELVVRNGATTKIKIITATLKGLFFTNKSSCEFK